MFVWFPLMNSLAPYLFPGFDEEPFIFDSDFADRVNTLTERLGQGMFCSACALGSSILKGI